MAKKTSSRKPSSKTVSSDIESVYKQTGIEDSSSDRMSEWLSDYCHTAASAFIEDWKRDNELEEAPEGVYEEVLYKIEENAGKDLWEHQRAWLLEAIELSAQKAASATNAPQSIDSPDEEKGIVSIIVHKNFLKIWEQATTGMGYSAWGGDERLDDVKSLNFVLQILDDVADVYGYESIKRIYERTVDDRFEPETGRYHELVKIADKAAKI